MGTNIETHNLTMCKEWEILKYSVLNRVSQGTLQKKDSKSLWEWKTPREYGLVYTVGLMHIA